MSCGLAILLSGCKPSYVPQNEAKVDVTETSPPSGEEVELPSSADAGQLISNYKLAYEAGAKRTLESLVYWGEADAAQRSVTTRYLIDGAGGKRVLEHRVRENADAFQGTGQHFTGEPTHVVELQIGTEKASKIFDWPIAKVGDEYQFLAWLRED